MSKHTPGPWKISVGSRVNRIEPIQGRQICCVGKSQMANAYLIASAPILLKAVKLAVLEFERISYQKKANALVLDCLDKAIKIAEGKNE